MLFRLIGKSKVSLFAISTNNKPIILGAALVPLESVQCYSTAVPRLGPAKIRFMLLSIA